MTQNMKMFYYSNKFDKKWKVVSEKNIEIIKANYYFTGVLVGK